MYNTWNVSLKSCLFCFLQSLTEQEVLNFVVFRLLWLCSSHLILFYQVFQFLFTVNFHTERSSGIFLVLCMMRMGMGLHTVSLREWFSVDDCTVAKVCLPSLLYHPGQVCRGSTFSDIMPKLSCFFAYLCKINVPFHLECQVDASVLNSTYF